LEFGFGLSALIRPTDGESGDAPVVSSVVCRGDPLSKVTVPTRPSVYFKPSTEPRRIKADLPLLEAIISGGQTGADQAGIHAGRALGLATGGYAPLGWKTLAGPMPSLGTDYGLIECGSPDYPARTARNVFNSDATVRFAADFNSPGELCTLHAINRYKKPHFDFDLDLLDEFQPQFVNWLTLHSVRVLNVAGNSSMECGRLTEIFLLTSLSRS
jgi:hypothetical protein